LQSGPIGHEFDKNEPLLKRAQGSSVLAKLVAAVANYISRSSFTNCLIHLEGEEVLGVAKRFVDCPPSVDKIPIIYVNFFCP
jgi:hypothetical protein